MSLSNSLNISLSGLSANQRGLDVVAGNIANAETEGFTRQTVSQSTLVADGRVTGVRVGTVERALNEQLQTQVRALASENVGNDIRADFLNRLDIAFGEPGQPTALDTGFNNAVAALEALSTAPEDFNAQREAVNDLRLFTNQLNDLTQTIQSLRQEADLGIQQNVDQANQALQRLEDVNARIVSGTANNISTASLEDERDVLIDQLAQIIDIDVSATANNGVRIQTESGVTLFSSRAAQIDFTLSGTVLPNSSNENGTLFNPTVTLGGGSFQTDLFGPSGVQEGSLAAFGYLRDDALVEVQSQLDAFAAQISLAISNVDVASTSVTGGLAVDLNGITNGNEVTLSIRTTTGNSQDITLVQVSDPTLLPVSQDFTANPNDVVIGIDFNAPTAAADIQTALNAALPTNGVTFSSAGTVLSVTSTVASNVTSLTANITNAGFTDNGLAFGLFQDGDLGSAFTNQVGITGGQTGFAGRIQLANQVINDPSLLSRFTSNTGNVGDSSRVDFILDRINDDIRTISPGTGLGSAASPLNVSISDFLQVIISTQGQRSEFAQAAQNASEVSFNNVQARLQSESAVNIDVELSRLIELEQAFQANARVLSTVQELADVLLNAVQ